MMRGGWLLVSMFGVMAAGVVKAATPEEEGMAIAVKVERANEGFQGETSLMEMVLVNAQGDRTIRRMTSQVLEVLADGDKSKIEFQWPADVKGTQMLTWAHKQGGDDQWLFLPSVRRVKRISANNKSGSFMGSEFAFEDLGSPEPEKFRHRFIREEEKAGRKLWVTERVPLDSNSGYSKQTVWTDQEYMSVVRVDYYDRKGDLLKTATFSGFEKIGKYWRAGMIEMVNHQTKKSSQLSWKDRKLGLSLRKGDFTSDELGG